MTDTHPFAPSYFEPIRRRAAGRWDQLERDPELAAPWVQLFNQVQSPRHVLSELLQNADDAGAGRVTVTLVAGRLVFEHDGQDFAEDHFDSLCKFAYSNKRKLHTIGFRGIGFKSTFSLGPEVRLATPTLAVAFRRERFTEPVWAGTPTADGRTRVTVQIDDPNRERDLAKNLAEWRASPASLLFFRHVRELDIDGTKLSRTTLGPGPVPNTARVRLSTLADRELLLVRSGAEAFPAECLDEVRRERGEPKLELPPCEVELVLGLVAQKRLHVVLPTGVTLDLPYSCNGPFIQDPARMAVKDPATSPTNRWLLGRVGRLAADVMLAWVGDKALPPTERARAYDLFPAGAHGGSGIDGDVSGAIRQAFQTALADARVLLTQSGGLAWGRDCLAPPRELYGVWDAARLGEVLGRPGVEVLAEVVPDITRGFLAVAGMLRVIAHDAFVARLREGDAVPRPGGWDRLAALWRFVNTRLRSGRADDERRAMALVPVQGEEVLYPADAVVRLATGRLSDEDAQFLAGNARVIDGGWLEFVGRNVQENADGNDDLRQTLTALGLSAASPAEKVLEVVWRRVFGADEVSEKDCVRIAHLAALLDARSPDALMYEAEDDGITPTSSGLIWDPDGRWDDLLPAEWLAEHRVNRVYDAAFTSCTRQQWTDWAGSPKSRLTSFPPLAASERSCWKESDLARALTPRGCPLPTDYPYPKGYFQLHDHDFLPDLVQHWTAERGEESVWGRVLESVLLADAALWADASQAKLYRHHTVTTKRPVTTEPIPAAWVHRFRSLKCLPDGYGVYREPAELYLRTPETEPLLGVEPFVRAELDTEATKPLLRLLGVRDTPAGADRLIARIRAWSQTPKSADHLREVVRWYEALDRVLARAGTAVVDEARAAFRAEPLVLTHTGDWARAAEVFQSADEDALPDTPAVHPAVRGLTLWNRLGVVDRPTSDHVLAWLQQLPPGAKLDGPTARRVQAASRRYPAVTWTRCGCWLTLAGEWTPTDAIKYRVSMQELTRWRDLFPTLRAATADLRGLPADVIQAPPFDALEDLTAAIEFRSTGPPPTGGEPAARPWVAALAAGLRRVRLPDEGHTRAVREAAARLARTTWQTVTRLLAQPWIGGEAVGDPSAAAALWSRDTLFVNGSRAKWFDPVADALARGFPDAGQVRQVIRDCIDRDPAFVAEYIAEKFELDAEEPLPEAVPAQPTATQAETGGNPPPGQSHQPSVPPAAGTSPPSPGGEPPAAPEPPAQGPSGEQPGNTPPEEPPPVTPPVTPVPTKQKPLPGPTLFERFAATLGFVGNEDRGFRHPDGSTLTKAAKPFGWELRGPDGLAVRNYAVVGDGLLTAGAEVPAELWSFITANPNRMTLVAAAPDGTPTDWPGPALIQLKNDSRLKVFPRVYLFRIDGV